MISDIVYDGTQYSNKKDLILAIENAISHINSEQRQKLEFLYESIGARLCKVLRRGGNLYNK